MPRKRPLRPTIDIVEFDRQVGHFIFSKKQSEYEEMWISEAQSDVDQLGTLIHECLHRWLPDLAERHVQAYEDDIMRVVRKYFVVKRKKKGVRK